MLLWHIVLTVHYYSFHITAILAEINFDLIIGLPSILQNNLLVFNHKHFQMNLSYFLNQKKRNLSELYGVSNDIETVSSLPILDIDIPDTTSHSLFPIVGNICDIIPDQSSSMKIVEESCSVGLLCLGSEMNISEEHNRLNIMDKSSIGSSKCKQGIVADPVVCRSIVVVESPGIETTGSSPELATQNPISHQTIIH